MNNCLFTLDKELKTDQHANSIKVQLGEPMRVLLGLLRGRDVGEVLPIGVEMTQTL